MAGRFSAVEGMGVTGAGFWRDRPVFITGATGLRDVRLLDSLWQDGSAPWKVWA